MLMFTKKNVKLDKLAALTGKKVFAFSLLSGHSCPFAKECLSKVIRVDGKSKIQDGPDTLFRCFSASSEVMYPIVYDHRKNNMDIVDACKNKQQILKLLRAALPKNAKGNIVRIHVGGDFNKLRYFDAWLQICRDNTDTIFYAYTKALPFWVRRLDDMPNNLAMTASYGGKFDYMIPEYNLRSATVVYPRWVKRKGKRIRQTGEEWAAEMKLDLDFDDHHAYDPTKKDVSFALLIHGTQPKKRD